MKTKSKQSQKRYLDPRGVEFYDFLESAKQRLKQTLLTPSQQKKILGELTKAFDLGQNVAETKRAEDDAGASI